MRLLVCGGAGFIGSTFARQRLLEHGDEVTVYDKLTYAGREENLEEVAGRPGFRFVRGAIEDPATLAATLDELRPDAIVNFAAETHVDRSIAEPDAFVKTHAVGTYVLLGGGARARAALPAGLHRRGLRLDRGGHLHRGEPAAALLALLGDQDRRGPARAELLPHLRAARDDLPRLEQLRPLPVPREADPADDPQRPARRPAARLRRRHAGPQLDPRDGTSRARSATCSSTGSSARSTTPAGPTRRRTSRSSRRIIELTGASESQIEHVADRPGHDRRYSLSSEKVRALGWEPGVRFEEGLAETVAWYRDNESWWGPIRSGEYRAYYERQYGQALQS